MNEQSTFCSGKKSNEKKNYLLLYVRLLFLFCFTLFTLRRSYNVIHCDKLNGDCHLGKEGRKEGEEER